MSSWPIAKYVIVLVVAFASCSASLAETLGHTGWPGERIENTDVEAGMSGVDVSDMMKRVSSDEGGGETRGAGPAITFCQLSGLRQYGRLGDVVGLAVTPTSWNIGDQAMDWYSSPDPRHPFTIMNMFRIRTIDGSDRFEQIGQSWVKHQFCALENSQCGGGCVPSGCSTLNVNCTETSSGSINASQPLLGPRHEVDPWTGDWSYGGSHFSQGSHDHDPVAHRLQVHDAGLDPEQNTGATYYVESSYVHKDDVNAMNSAGWKPVTVEGPLGGTWNYEMTGMSTMPQIGFAIDAWTDARQTLLAQQVPVIEFVSPDGRCVLAAKATDLGGGTWHYEYALLNIDMDRQVGSFSIPVAAGTAVTNVGFHAAEHHDENYNTTDPDAVPIDNAPWSAEFTRGAVTWSTASNPLRWGTLYNFRFDADAPPGTTVVALGLFRPGTPDQVVGATVGPQFRAIPAVSRQGVFVMTLLLAVGTAVIARRRKRST